MALTNQNFFDIVASIDDWPYYEDNPRRYQDVIRHYFVFMVGSSETPVGLIHENFIRAISWADPWSVEDRKRRLTLHCSDDFDFDSRTKAVDALLRSKQAVKASSSLESWSDDIDLPVYDNSGTHVFNVNASGLDVLGLKSSWAVLVSWTTTKEGRKYWIRKQSASLGCPVMHRIGKETPLQALLRGLKLDHFELGNRLKFCDVLGVACARSSRGRPAYKPLTFYIYELALDSEVEDIYGDPGDMMLMSAELICQGMKANMFFSYASAVLIAHFIRMGIIKPEEENESIVAELSARLHRRRGLFIPPSADDFTGAQLGVTP